MRELKIILTLFVAFLLIDIPMITRINNAMYKAQFLRINSGPMNGDLRTYLSAFICYTLLVFGVYYFSVRQNNIFNAALIGLIVYGVYNTTNLATINQFGIKEAIVDTLWGTSLCTIISYIAVKIFN